MFLWPYLDVLHGRLGFSHDSAIQATAVIANAGLYNGFIASGLLWTLIERGGTYRIQVFFLWCVIIAGVFGFFTLDWPILALQTLPGAVALTAVRRAAPKPKWELGREYVQPHEEEDIAEVLRLGDEILRLSKLPVLRGQHAKGTAGVRAKFVVEEDRPTETRVGVFATARTFDAVVRFSNGIGRIQPDIKADARGMAIKVLGVDGPQALSEEGDQSSQDFVMINFPVFAFRDARQYASFFVLKRFFMGMLGPAGNQVAQLFFFLPWHFRQFWEVGRKIKGISKNVLTEQYWSMSAYRLGTHAIKFTVRPQDVNRTTSPTTPSEGQIADDYPVPGTD